MPSNRAPIRSMAARDRSLRASACRQTVATPQVSNARLSIRRFISVFAPVRSEFRFSQVQPISAVSGIRASSLGAPASAQGQ
jgi:hypothetical protein